MKKVLIVDDDTIIRITLRSLICWEDFGYQIIGDAVHGQQALEFLETSEADLVITDMKMPVTDGISLLKELGKKKSMPAVLVLSGYDDFNLVRESFRLGAYDYLLKSDLTEEGLAAMLKRMEADLWPEGRKSSAESAIWAAEVPDSVLLSDMAMGKRPLDGTFFEREYFVAQFEIQDFSKAAFRFSENYEEELTAPFLQLAGQIARVNSHCILGSISPSRYVLLYRISESEQGEENIVSACRQLIHVWKHFMNLSVSAGISTRGKGSETFLNCFEEAGQWLMLCCLKGKSEICFPWEKDVVSYEQVCAVRETYKRLLSGILAGDEFTVSEGKKLLFGEMYGKELKKAKETALHLICSLALRLSDNRDDLSSLFAEEVNYYEKIGRLEEMGSLELWMNNYFRWIMDYTAHKNDRRQADLMIRAKRFILDNYANPELTLKSVADFVGLNEKYFSTRFTGKEGMTFSNYLTGVRIRKAKELMETTNLKIYEISQSVGYNSVEHFTRMFKRVCKVSPGSWRK